MTAATDAEVLAARLDSLRRWINDLQQAGACPSFVNIQQFNAHIFAWQAKGHKNHPALGLPAKSLTAVGHALQGEGNFLRHDVRYSSSAASKVSSSSSVVWPM